MPPLNIVASDTSSLANPQHQQFAIQFDQMNQQKLFAVKADNTVQDCSAAVTSYHMFEDCAAPLVGLNVVAATMTVVAIVGIQTAAGNEVVGAFATAAVIPGFVVVMMLVKPALFDVYCQSLDAEKSVADDVSAVYQQHYFVSPYVDVVNAELAVDTWPVAVV